VASLKKSRYPVQHHVVSFSSKLGEDEVTLAEVLQSAQYLAGGFSANYRLLGALGYGQGFQRWHADFHPGKGERADVLSRLALEWIDQTRATSDRPLLLYLQLMEPHAPYEAREPFRAQFASPPPGAKDAATSNEHLVAMRWHQLTRADVDLLASLYDAEVADADAALRALFDALGQRNVLRDAVIIITADHGEEFWEHGQLTHGTSLYNETVHVPLLVIAPGYAGGHRVEQNVSLLDIAPTVLDLVGHDAEARFEGRSLVPLLRPMTMMARLKAWRRGAQSAPPPDVVLQLEATGYGFDAREHTDGLIRESTKLLMRPGGFDEVYDLAQDPGEKSNHPESAAAMTDALKQDLQAARTDLSERAGVAVKGAPLDDATREKLRALGYHF
jgi:arylsulfatase A-like enzyme